MGNADMRVDGNALAGVLREVFVHEMTSARVKCEGCGEVEPMGAEHVYMQAPGAVVRCCHCEDVLLVITQRDGGYLLGFQQVMWLEIG
jgi:ribosomal protein S27E